MYYNIENSFSKLQKTSQPKVEVKEGGNIVEVKRKKTEIDCHSKGGRTGLRERIPQNGHIRQVHPINRE